MQILIILHYDCIQLFIAVEMYVNVKLTSLQKFG